MKPPKRIRQKSNPEEQIQNKIIAYLEARGWLVRVVNAGARNFGWPDLRIAHSHWGGFWVEVKLPNMKGSRFTKAQREWFPKMVQNGDHIWIMTAANDHNYNLLFTRPTGNLMEYWK